MSLYGNVKKIASSTFLFDRVYHTRKEMEDNCLSDGVYAGRYILINYGLSLTNELYDDEGHKLEFIDVGQRYLKVDDSGAIIENGNGAAIRETELYQQNKAIDIEEYGAVYDSTVWLKIYAGEFGEKYIMVAELNALAPKLDLNIVDPLIYKHSDEEHLAEEIWVEDNTYDDNNIITKKSITEVLQETYEDIQLPEFNLINSNELGYVLNMPKPIHVNLANENINYNEQGFDSVYSVPVDLLNVIEDNENSYIKWTTDGLTKTDVLSGNEVKANTKSLHINLPNFGNLMLDLYDLVYGAPSENDNTHVRPFFKKYWPSTITVPGAEEGTEEEIDRTYLNDDKEWMSDVPELGEILANNTEGLMGVLGSLFGVRDPLNGTIRYYLSTDWNNYYDENSNAPYIDNKPEVVGYNYTIIENNEKIKYKSACDYTINYDSWTLEHSS